MTKIFLKAPPFTYVKSGMLKVLYVSPCISPISTNGYRHSTCQKFSCRIFDSHSNKNNKPQLRKLHQTQDICIV